jgi:hypothetical protein
VKVSGKFEVKLSPLSFSSQGIDLIKLSRMAVYKRYKGDLQATSKGEMLSVMTSVKGSAGYVAIEQVAGTLSGRKGSFVLQHFGTMNKGKDRLILEVVPDSGTNQLSGLVGTMVNRVEDGQHFYEFDYELT